VQTALKIQQNRSVGEFSPLPFVSLLTNCIIWSYYGALRSDLTVLLPNAVGILSGAFGCYTFQKFSSIPQKMIAVAAVLVGITSCFAFRGDAYLIGLLGCAISIVLSGSPLATVSTVIKTKSTASLPFLLCLSTFLNGTSWLLYGLILAKDPLVSSS
jgi:solute carrier family 50 (sugar transporter)